jgi:hypothetical protein
MSLRDKLAEKRTAARFIANERGIMSEVRMIGGALVAIVIIALVLTEVYAAVDINNSSPFYGIVESAESTGVAAITLLVVGLLVLAASVIMRFMGGSFGR